MKTFLVVFGISFIFKVDNTSAGRKLELLGDVGIPGEHAAGPDMVHIVPLYVGGSQDAVFPEKLVIEQADLYAAVDNSCDIFQRGIPVRGHRLRRFLAPQQEVAPVVECLVYEIPVNAVTGKTVLAGESSDFHVRKLGSAELIARMCSAFLAPYSP